MYRNYTTLENAQILLIFRSFLCAEHICPFYINLKSRWVTKEEIKPMISLNNYYIQCQFLQIGTGYHPVEIKQIIITKKLNVYTFI